MRRSGSRCRIFRRSRAVDRIGVRRLDPSCGLAPGPLVVVGLQTPMLPRSKVAGTFREQKWSSVFRMPEMQSLLLL